MSIWRSDWIGSDWIDSDWTELNSIGLSGDRRVRENSAILEWASIELKLVGSLWNEINVIWKLYLETGKLTV